MEIGQECQVGVGWVLLLMLLLRKLNPVRSRREDWLIIYLDIAAIRPVARSCHVCQLSILQKHIPEIEN